MENLQANASPKGKPIINNNGKLIIPDHPVIPYIIGDGIGNDIWKATQPVLDAAVTLAYKAQRRIDWLEVPINIKTPDKTSSRLPEELINVFRTHSVGIKGPLSTPVGGGFRSLNVALRQSLDLYACIRPVQYIPGSPSPVRQPDLINMIIFRENTEDIYTGIEFEYGSDELRSFMLWVKSNHPENYHKIRFPEGSSIGIKPISKDGSQRLVRSAIKYALDNNRRKITLVHKGNIMKFTEGAFAKWGYELAETEFSSHVFTQNQFNSIKRISDEESAINAQSQAVAEGKLIVNDVITDAAFEQTLTRPEEFDVIATTNLNGDYLSDALAAQIGGLGISPGVNINFEDNIAIFEATHGTAPTIAGKNIANPCSLILSGTMLLDHIGWQDAATLVRFGIQSALGDKLVTMDFYRLLEGATLLSTTGFGQAVITKMELFSSDYIN